MAASSLFLKRVYHSSSFFKILKPAAARFITSIPFGGAVHRRPFHSSAAFNNDHRPPAGSADNRQMSKNEEIKKGYRISFSREPVFSKTDGELETRDDSENHYMLFDLPGFTKQDLNVWLEENVLTIIGVINEKEFEEEEEDNMNVFHVVVFMNPSLHQLDAMEIEVRNGILYVVLPKLKKTPGIKQFQE